MRRKGWTAVKKMVCTAAVLVLLLMNAAALPELGALHAKSAALYAANGQELYVSNADEKLQPASVTKIMTMLLAMEALERGEVTLDTMITGSEHACSMGGTQIWLEPGEQLTLDEMLKAIAVGSANDCAVAVAEHLAGTEAAFVERMNARARELGCTGTTFINANGLDGEGERTLTTARDLALISCELLRHPKILDYTGIWMDSIRGGKFALANTNKMLRSYKRLTGLKTGYIREAGFCISASAEREGLSLVAVVMAAPTKDWPHGRRGSPAELRLRKLHGVDTAGGELRGRSGHAGARGHSRAAHGGRQRLRARKERGIHGRGRAKGTRKPDRARRGRTAGRRADRQKRRRNPADRAAVRGGERGGGHGFRSVRPFRALGHRNGSVTHGAAFSECVLFDERFVNPACDFGKSMVH